MFLKKYNDLMKFHCENSGVINLRITRVDYYRNKNQGESNLP